MLNETVLSSFVKSLDFGSLSTDLSGKYRLKWVPDLLTSEDGQALSGKQSLGIMLPKLVLEVVHG